jgi:hypothetical protein
MFFEKQFYILLTPTGCKYNSQGWSERGERNPWNALSRSSKSCKDVIMTDLLRPYRAGRPTCH